MTNEGYITKLERVEIVKKSEIWKEIEESGIEERRRRMIVFNLKLSEVKMNKMLIWDMFEMIGVFLGCFRYNFDDEERWE